MTADADPPSKVLQEAASESLDRPVGAILRGFFLHGICQQNSQPLDKAEIVAVFLRRTI